MVYHIRCIRIAAHQERARDKRKGSFSKSRVPQQTDHDLRGDKISWPAGTHPAKEEAPVSLSRPQTDRAPPSKHAPHPRRVHRRRKYGAIRQSARGWRRSYHSRLAALSAARFVFVLQTIEASQLAERSPANCCGKNDPRERS